MKQSDKIKIDHTPEHEHAIVYGIENKKAYDKGELGVLIPQIERLKDYGMGPSYYHLNGGPYVVLTIEQLRDLWYIGYNNGYTTCQMRIEPDLDAFKRYLQSKGITIP